MLVSVLHRSTEQPLAASQPAQSSPGSTQYPLGWGSSKKAGAQSFRPQLQVWSAGAQQAAGADVLALLLRSEGWEVAWRERELDSHRRDSGLHREQPWGLVSQWPGPLSS